MARPISSEYGVNQAFGGYATAGVIGRYGGTEIETLVAMYGDYQPYGHAGADCACPIGTPVYAMLDGVVVWADWGENLPGDDSWGPSGYFKRWGLYKNFPGIVTVIHHPQLGKYSVYGHLSSNDVAPAGTRVVAGQLIGYSGNTKTRTETVGPHLHVAMVADPVTYRTGGGLIFGCEDPVPYFTQGGGSLNPSSASIYTQDQQFLMDLFGAL
jgi:murein DD-endopeptidase MepM/ murein hydrolase activator NlpD